MTPEIIERDGQSYAVVPLELFDRIAQDAEMLADIEAYDQAMQALERGDDEVIPWEMVERRIAGEEPVKIWREYRGFTQATLAQKTGVSRAMIAQLETGAKQPSANTLKKLAQALECDMEDLCS